MKRVRLTMSQALVKFLDNQYIECDGVETKFVSGMFGIFGHGCVVGVGQALEQGGHNLKFYQGKNEQNMALAAVAYAKQMDRKAIIPCVSSIGPGATNMVTACGCATANRIPLLVLPGDTFACRQPDPVLQQAEFFDNYGRTVTDAFKGVCHYFDRILRPEQLMTACINAMRVLTDPADTGAVCLAMPQDVEGEAYDYPEHFLQKRVWHLDRRPISAAQLERATRLIKEAKKPIIVCGGGVRYSGAENELLEFATKYNIPIAETQAGKGLIKWDNPLNVGGIGVTGGKAANVIGRDADLVIGVGTRFTDFTTSSKWLFNEQRKVLGINVCLFDNMGWGCIENLQNNQGTDTFGTVFRARNPVTGMLDGDEIDVDFAKIAEGYGAKAYTVRTSDELREALKDAKKQTKSCLFDIKVLPKTMTPGFESWWRVGVAEVSKSERVAKAYDDMQKHIKETFDY